MNFCHFHVNQCFTFHLSNVSKILCMYKTWPGVCEKLFKITSKATKRPLQKSGKFKFSYFFGTKPWKSLFLKKSWQYTANVLSVEIANVYLLSQSKNKHLLSLCTDICVWLIKDIFMCFLSQISSWICWRIIILSSYYRYLSVILENVFYDSQIFSVSLLNIVIICYFDR